MMVEIRAMGHKNITARHRTTIEITKDPDLGPNGDCIVAVRADKAFSDLDEPFKEALRSSRMRVTFHCNGHVWSVEGHGTKGLGMRDENEMVMRKSGYESDRTLMVNSDKAACDIPKDMVSCLRDPESEVRIFIETLCRQDNSCPHQNNRI